MHFDSAERATAFADAADAAARDIFMAECEVKKAEKVGPQLAQIGPSFTMPDPTLDRRLCEAASICLARCAVSSWGAAGSSVAPRDGAHECWPSVELPVCLASPG